MNIIGLARHVLNDFEQIAIIGVLVVAIISLVYAWLLRGTVLKKDKGTDKMQVIWNAEDDQVDLIQLKQLAVVCEMPRDAVPARKLSSLASGGRGHGDYFGAGATLKGVGMNGGDKARTHQAHANFVLHDRLQPFRYS